MCLYVHSGPHIADKDISVIKILGVNNYSEYRSFLYEAGHTYTLERRIEVRHNGTIHDGFHAYRSEDVEEVNFFCGKQKDDPDSLPRYEIAFGGCAVKGKYDRNFAWQKWVRFVIPKGATYYIGVGGDIVSDQIRALSLQPIRPRDLRKKIQKRKR